MLNMLGKAEANKTNPNRGTRNAVSEMKEMADVHSVLDMLHFIETRYVSVCSIYLKSHSKLQMAHCR